MKVARVGHDVLFSQKRGKKTRHISAIFVGCRGKASRRVGTRPGPNHVCHPVANADSCVFQAIFILKTQIYYMSVISIGWCNLIVVFPSSFPLSAKRRLKKVFFA